MLPFGPIWRQARAVLTKEPMEEASKDRGQRKRLLCQDEGVMAGKRSAG